MTKTLTDQFAVLGVERDAPPEDIKRRYRDLARQFHPDMNPGDAAAEERFKEITAAYDILSDPDRRLTHLVDLRQAEARQRNSDFQGQGARRGPWPGDSAPSAPPQPPRPPRKAAEVRVRPLTYIAASIPLPVWLLAAANVWCLVGAVILPAATERSAAGAAGGFATFLSLAATSVAAAWLLAQKRLYVAAGVIPAVVMFFAANGINGVTTGSYGTLEGGALFVVLLVAVPAVYLIAAEAGVVDWLLHVSRLWVAAAAALVAAAATASLPILGDLSMNVAVVVVLAVAALAAAATFFGIRAALDRRAARAEVPRFGEVWHGDLPRTDNMNVAGTARVLIVDVNTRKGYADGFATYERQRPGDNVPTDTSPVRVPLAALVKRESLSGAPLARLLWGWKGNLYDLSA